MCSNLEEKKTSFNSLKIFSNATISKRSATDKKPVPALNLYRSGFDTGLKLEEMK